MMSDRKIALWSFVIGLLSAAFGIWAYIDSKQTLQITYSLSHESLYRPSTILNTFLSLPQSSNLTKERTTQTVITIWNGGTAALKGEDTRSKLTLSGDSSVKLLAHKIALTKTFPGSTGFSVSNDENKLIIDWHLFDPGEGIQIVLLSIGNSGSLDLSGRFAPGMEIVRYPVKSNMKTFVVLAVWLGGGFITFLFFTKIVSFIHHLASSYILSIAMSLFTFVIIFLISVYGAYRILTSVRIYIGDLPPIDTNIEYIDINRKLDYRYVPM